jgi:hypothetical protein
MNTRAFPRAASCRAAETARVGAQEPSPQFQPCIGCKQSTRGRVTVGNGVDREVLVACSDACAAWYRATRGHEGTGPAPQEPGREEGIHDAR